MSKTRKTDQNGFIKPTDAIKCLNCGELSDMGPNDRYQEFLKPHLRSCGNPNDMLSDLFEWVKLESPTHGPEFA